MAGGAVRNALLGEPIGDIDIATTLQPQDVMTAFNAAGISVHPTGIEHGTVTVVVDHKPYEITTLAPGCKNRWAPCRCCLYR